MAIALKLARRSGGTLNRATFYVLLAAVVLIVWLVANGCTEISKPSASSRSAGVPVRFQGPVCTVQSKKYIPSKLEQQWMAHAEEWDQTFCEQVPKFKKEADLWIRKVQDLAAGAKTNVSSEFADVFSSFETRYTCHGGKEEVLKTWIEPLSHGLRHPHSICINDSKVLDPDYVVLATGVDVASARQILHGSKDSNCSSLDRCPCMNIIFDLGASVWGDWGGLGQKWFVDHYKQRGLDFDRLLLWEVGAVADSEIYKRVPKEYHHRYQYFNVPAATDPTDVSSPLGMLRKIARPCDFVAFKLDVDNASVETPIVEALLGDPELLDLVDEFIFEFHVTFQPMAKWWGSSMAPNKTLKDAYQLFALLREKGIRSHSWV